MLIAPGMCRLLNSPLRQHVDDLSAFLVDEAKHLVASDVDNHPDQPLFGAVAASTQPMEGQPVGLEKAWRAGHAAPRPESFARPSNNWGFISGSLLPSSSTNRLHHCEVAAMRDRSSSGYKRTELDAARSRSAQAAPGLDTRDDAEPTPQSIGAGASGPRPPIPRSEQFSSCPGRGFAAVVAMGNARDHEALHGTHLLLARSTSGWAVTAG